MLQFDRKKVTVVKGRFHDRIINLNNELGGGIIIEEIMRYNIEDLVRMVSEVRLNILLQKMT